MDAQTETIMTTEIPAGLDPATVSLSDLRQLRQTWLDQAKANGYLGAAHEVCTVLGERFEQEMRYPWNVEPAWRWTSPNGSVSIRIYQKIGKWLPRLGGYSITQRMHIEAPDSHGNPQLVCRYAFFNHDYYSDQQGFFVPGRWVDVVLAALETAQDTRVDGIKREQERERRDLTRLLCIGRGV